MSYEAEQGCAVGSRYTLDVGDSLALMRGMSAASVDAMITDPPYLATGESSSFVAVGATQPVELQFYRAWLSELLGEANRILRADSAIWLTIDWRGALAFEQAACAAGWKRPKVGVWDRGGLGMGYAMRNTYECFCITYRGSWQPESRSVPDVWRFQWTPGDRRNGHSAEKPIELMRRAVRHVCPPGGTVFDPFAGSGTTGVAALLEGRRFVGCELSEHYAAIARRRMSEAAGEFAEHAGQPSLFEGLKCPAE